MVSLATSQDVTRWVLQYPAHPITGEHLPNPKQALAHQCPADIILMGGARGGGKTEWTGVDSGVNFLQHEDMLGFYFRKTREEMKFTVLRKLQAFYPPHVARWSSDNHAFIFANGATLVLDFLDSEESIGRYLGAEAGVIYVDQAEQLTEFTVAQALTLLRSPKPWPKQLKLTANPGKGVGVGWLKRWFIDPTDEELGGRRKPNQMEIWRPLPKEGDPTPIDQVPSRCFIPARFQDNTALQASDPGYLGKIYAGFTPAIARAQAEGDWDASEGTIVGSVWAAKRTVQETDVALLAQGLKAGQLVPWHVIPDKAWRPPVGALIYGSIDYGFGVPFSFHLHATMSDGRTRTFYEIYGTRITSGKQAERIADALASLTYADGNTLVKTGLQWIVYDPSMDASRAEMLLAMTIIEEYQDVFEARFGKPLPLIAGAAGRNARLMRPNRWLDALATGLNGWPNWSCTSACPDLIRTVKEIPPDPDDPDVEDDDSENHAYEDVGRFFEARPHAPRVNAQDAALAGLDQMSREHQERMQKQYNPKRVPRITVPGMQR